MKRPGRKSLALLACLAVLVIALGGRILASSLRKLFHSSAFEQMVSGRSAIIASSSDENPDGETPSTSTRTLNSSKVSHARSNASTQPSASPSSSILPNSKSSNEVAGFNNASGSRNPSALTAPSPGPGGTLPTGGSSAGLADTSSSKGLQRLGFDFSGNRLLLNIQCDFDWDNCPVVNAWVDGIKKNTQKMVEQIYAGKLPDLSGNPSSNASMEVPICNRNAGETSTNHLGQSCGKSTCSISQTGSQTPTLDMSSCERERAWARGELIQDIQNALTSVLHEFTVDQLVYIGDRCMSIQVDPDFSYDVTNYNAVNDRWTTVNGSRHIACDISGDTPFDPAQESEAQNGIYENDRRIPVQAGCQLNAGLNALGAAIASMSTCEVFSRADIQWNNKGMPAVNGSIGGSISSAIDRCKQDPSTSCLSSSYGRNIEQGWANSSSANPVSINLTCVQGAPGCTCNDISFCGSGSALSRVELFTLNSAVQSLRTASQAMDAAEALMSKTQAQSLGLELGTPRGGSCISQSRF